MPFFKLLKASKKFTWMPEANKAFAELKQFLTMPPVMMAPQAGKTLLIYIAATNRVVGIAIVIE